MPSNSFVQVKTTTTGEIAVSFDFSKAPQSTETFAASNCYLVEMPSDEICFNFVQYDSISQEPRAIVEVKMDDLSTLNFWKNSSEFYQRLLNWRKDLYGKDVEPAPRVRPGGGARSFQVAANIAFMGHQGNAGLAAFYWFDPRAARDLALKRAPNQALLGVPVVEIKTSATALIGLLGDCKKYVEKLTAANPKLSAQMVHLPQIEKGTAK